MFFHVFSFIILITELTKLISKCNNCFPILLLHLITSEVRILKYYIEHNLLQTNNFYMLLTQMPRTSSDKLFLGKEYIDNLSSTHLCTSFHGGVTKCKCIQNVQEHLDDVKKYFWMIHATQLIFIHFTGNTFLQSITPIWKEYDCYSDENN